MKQISAFALFTVVAVAASSPLVAQQPVVKANIPFNFTVGDQSMPAGEYTISSPLHHIIQVQSADRKHVGMVVSTASFREPAASPALVFDKYGEYYFLHRILSPTNTALNLDIPLGKAEKKVRTREATLRTEEPTLVAAR